MGYISTKGDSDMKKIIWMTIGEKAYPLRCTLGAWEKLYEIYGDAEGFAKAFQDSSTTYKAGLDALTMFVAQGCAYANFAEADDPGFPAGGYTAPTREQLATIFDLADYADIIAKVNECITESRHTEINAKAAKGTKKKTAGEATN